MKLSSLLFALLSVEAQANGAQLGSAGGLRRDLASCASEGEDCGTGYRDCCSGGTCDWVDFNTKKCSAPPAKTVGPLKLKASDGGVALCLANTDRRLVPKSNWSAKTRKCSLNVPEWEFADGRLKWTKGNICIAAIGLNSDIKFYNCGTSADKETWIYDSAAQTYYNAKYNGYLWVGNTNEKTKLNLKEKINGDEKQSWYFI